MFEVTGESGTYRFDHDGLIYDVSEPGTATLQNYVWRWIDGRVHARHADVRQAEWYPLTEVFQSAARAYLNQLITSI